MSIFGIGSFKMQVKMNSLVWAYSNMTFAIIPSFRICAQRKVHIKTLEKKGSLQPSRKVSKETNSTAP
jgi:hypothetical protein